MNLNKLTKSYIKDIFHLIKKWNLSEIHVDIDEYEVIFIKGEDYRILIYDDDGKFQKIFIKKDLKELLERFEKSPYYMAKIIK